MPDRKSFNILIDFTPVSEFQRQIMLGATRYIHEQRGHRVRTANTEINMARDADTIDGVIAIVESADANHRSTRFGKPVVNVSSITYPVPFPTITIDNRALGKLAAQHLMQQGYRSFAYHAESRVFFSRERLAGYTDALKDAGYSTSVFDTSNYIAASASQVHGATLDWLKGLPKPLGLFTHNDQRAVALIDICVDAGIEVPQTVGVIGADNDSLLTGTCNPKLSSVDPGTELVGYRAAELLIQLMQNASAPKQITGTQITGTQIIWLPPRTVLARESTTPRLFHDDRLTAALSYIRENATLGISVTDVLKVAHCSRRSLERLFVNNLGYSPAQEIRQKQIHHAMWLLAQSDRSLIEISQRCGYSAFRNFATAFRRETGLTAAAYRKKVSN